MALADGVRLAVAGHHGRAASRIEQALARAEPGSQAWWLPVEPILCVTAHPRLGTVSPNFVTARPDDARETLIAQFEPSESVFCPAKRSKETLRELSFSRALKTSAAPRSHDAPQEVRDAYRNAGGVVGVDP
jgi:hypothetical protein